ncbi:MAG: type II toxin-antitoxin system MqsA family antitoxin [Methylococcales bacterium]
MNQPSMVTCELCGNEGARIRKSTRSYGKGKQLLVIENVPMISCPHCGESYLMADTMYELERIKLHRKSFATERPVRVAEYPLAESRDDNSLQLSP